METNEYEKKYLLSENEYILFLEYFNNLKKVKIINQINYYYDTSELSLYQKGETLRIRQINDKLKLEFKYDKRTIDGVRVCKEHVKKIKNLPKKIVGLSDAEYSYIGFLYTERNNFEFDEYIVSIDKNFYLGIVDFEMEIESEYEVKFPEYKQILNKRCSNLGKYTRFINKYKNQDVKYEI